MCSKMARFHRRREGVRNYTAAARAQRTRESGVNLTLFVCDTRRVIVQGKTSTRELLKLTPDTHTHTRFFFGFQFVLFPFTVAQSSYVIMPNERHPSLYQDSSRLLLLILFRP